MSASASIPTAPAPIDLHSPGSSHPSLLSSPAGSFDARGFMGSWGVAWSTLPMWKGKKGKSGSLTYLTTTTGSPSGGYPDRMGWKIHQANMVDVVITYENPSSDFSSFDSTVASRKESAAADSSPSTVRGRETQTKGGPNAATYDWQGKSYLFFVHSHWEVLGYGKDEEKGLDWAVTYFSKTLFTPAGLDIYIRATPSAPNPAAGDLGVRADLVRRIAASLGQVKGVEDLAKSGFEVPGIV